MNLVRAIYPGSFDPLTNGHLDLIERGSKIFEELIVAILRNSEKDPLFTLPERKEMLQEMVKNYPNVRVDSFDGLLVDYAMKKNAKAVLRGIRAISDYEYELQMALMNRKLQPQLEPVFMASGETYSYLSSRLVKEIFRLGGSVRGLVPDLVEEKMREKLHGTATTIQVEGLLMATVPAIKQFSDRVNRIEISATMAVVAEASKLKAAGADMVEFGAGEPHYATPQHIKDAAIAAIQQNFTKY